MKRRKSSRNFRCRSPQRHLPKLQRLGRTLARATTATESLRYIKPLRTLTCVRGKLRKRLCSSGTYLEHTQPNTTNPRRVAKLAYAPSTYTRLYPDSGNLSHTDDILRSRSIAVFASRFLISCYWTISKKCCNAKLQAEFDSTEGRGRIYPGLALSYCYWWEGQRDKAQEVLSALQKEFSDDLTLKINTFFTAIQHWATRNSSMALLEELVEVEPRNRRQYYDLMLQVAMRSGNSSRVRELVTKLLNSPSGVRELHQFSEKLHEAGFKQSAVAVAKKTVDLAVGERDPNFLTDLSQHLDLLGQEQDAEYIAERALRFANQRDRYGQMLYSFNFRSATRLASRATDAPDRERKLIAAVQKKPESHRAHLRLAIFYESTHQPKKASEAFKTLLALRPKDSMTRYPLHPDVTEDWTGESGC